MARPKALLLTIRHDNREMEELSFSLGYDLVDVVRQNRRRPDPQWFLGRGKLEEAREHARALGVDVVIVNESLKPNQLFNLNDFFREAGRDEPSTADATPTNPLEAPTREDAEGHRAQTRIGAAIHVFDRVRVILEIFSERARSPEARLQVELATLQYEMPLVKEFIHLTKKGEHPGFLAGGEYEVRQYEEMIRKRIARIRRDLKRVSDERDVRRKHRRKKGFHLVSLAGYTNAGKSTLLRALSAPRGNGSARPRVSPDVLVENRYFSTLSTKTRRAVSDKREILVTDTVGFIEELPPWIVDAFHSTLEEIALADVVVLVVDVSDPLPELTRKLRSSLVTLWEFDTKPRGGNGRASDTGPWARSFPQPAHAEGNGEDIRPGTGAGVRASSASDESSWITDAVQGPASLAPVLVALNKADAVTEDEFQRKVRALQDEGLVGGNWVRISAKAANGFDGLFDAIYALIPDYASFEATLPPSPEAESFLAWAFDATDVLNVERGNDVRVELEAKASLEDELRTRVGEVGGSIGPHAT